MFKWCVVNRHFRAAIDFLFYFARTVRELITLAPHSCIQWSNSTPRHRLCGSGGDLGTGCGPPAATCATFPVKNSLLPQKPTNTCRFLAGLRGFHPQHPRQDTILPGFAARDRNWPGRYGRLTANQIDRTLHGTRPETINAPPE